MGSGLELGLGRVGVGVEIKIGKLGLELGLVIVRFGVGIRVGKRWG